jgi:creatinine amidohydrolase/Fe(II)-dependent formamide hydrolase-like protein
LATAKRFRAVAFANVHLEPRHIDCLKKAVEEANKAGASACWVDIQKKRWASQLGEAFAKGDHAGAWETSLMMAASAGMVRDSVRRNLPPLDEIDPQKRKTAKSFVEAGGEDAYFGDPTAATLEDGEVYFEALAQVLSVSVREHLGSKA